MGIYYMLGTELGICEQDVPGIYGAENLQYQFYFLMVVVGLRKLRIKMHNPCRNKTKEERLMG